MGGVTASPITLSTLFRAQDNTGRVEAVNRRNLAISGTSKSSPFDGKVQGNECTRGNGLEIGR